jgi:hypothetical protein
VQSPTSTSTAAGMTKSGKKSWTSSSPYQGWEQHAVLRVAFDICAEHGFLALPLSHEERYSCSRIKRRMSMLVGTRCHEAQNLSL